MKYKIEIWQYYNIVETYESDNIEYVLSWYRANWWLTYENGGCAFSVYMNNEELSFEEKIDLGFIDFD